MPKASREMVSWLTSVTDFDHMNTERDLLGIINNKLYITIK